MSITTKWLIEHGYQLREDGWYKGISPGGPSPCAHTKPTVQDGGVAEIPGEKSHPPSRRRVCVTSYRCISTDADALVVKWFVDGLRYCGVIPNDTRKDIELVVREELVKHKCDERTEIDITMKE